MAYTRGADSQHYYIDFPQTLGITKDKSDSQGGAFIHLESDKC